MGSYQKKESKERKEMGCHKLTALFVACLFFVQAFAEIHSASCSTYDSVVAGPTVQGHKCSACIPLSLGDLIDIKDKLDLLDIDLALKQLVPPGEASWGFGSINVDLGVTTLSVDLPSIDVHDILGIFPSISCNVGSGMVEPVVEKLLDFMNLLGGVCMEVYFEECREAVGLVLSMGSSRVFEVQFNLRDYLSCEKPSETFGDIEVTFDYENREITVCRPLLNGLFDSNICVVVADILWSLKAFSFTPTIRLDSTFSQFTSGPLEFPITTISVGQVDECYPNTDCGSCAANPNCGWCNIKQVCMPMASESTPSKCGSCPEKLLSTCRVVNRNDVTNRNKLCGDFIDYDANGDWLLSYEEFESTVGKFLPPDDVLTVFTDLDADKDTRISFDEYCYNAESPVAPPSTSPEPTQSASSSAAPTQEPTRQILAPSSAEEKKNLSVGALVGIIIAAILVFAVLAFFVVFLILKKKSPFHAEKMAFWQNSKLKRMSGM